MVQEVLPEVWERWELVSMALFYSGCLTSIVCRFHPSSQKRKERRADGRMEGLRPCYTFGRNLECFSTLEKLILTALRLDLESSVQPRERNIELYKNTPRLQEGLGG